MEHCVILISATGEWRAVRKLFPEDACLTNPFGEYFTRFIDHQRCTFFYGGWGKIAASASAQYVIDRWQPDLLVNLGTCGGFAGLIQKGEIILVDKTRGYYIYEQMGDFDAHIAHFTTQIDLDWLPQPYPTPVRRAMLVSGDRDLLVEDIPMLKERYAAIAGDWESGAIAWVAARNHVRTLILRGVTDLVDSQGSAAYGNLDYFEVAAFEIIEKLVHSLPGWLEQISKILINTDKK
jgi:adenosylhomocysteine nucleosidase